MGESRIRDMRLIVTADLHYNHAHSQAQTQDMIERINRVGGDVLMLVGDTCVPEGDGLERCLSRILFKGPKLFVAGNHELWTSGQDSYAIFKEELPRRVGALGWRWLEDEPFVENSTAIVGSIGWYDYSFAPQGLNVPRRFYEQKISPGAAANLAEFAHLFNSPEDIPASSLEIVARWNDGRYVKLHRSDEEFLEEVLENLQGHLESLSGMRTIVAGIHHVPFAELLPPPYKAHWDFAKAYLGSARIGELLLRYPAVRYVFCGHSHMPCQTRIGSIHAVNVGSGYWCKRYRVLEVPD